ncbi:MAG: hypothetical protein ACRC2T_11345 [Thermoguttaceae bacterium]
MKKFTERANRLQDLFGSISQKTADDFGLFLRSRKISAMDFVTADVPLNDGEKTTYLFCLQ